eukprot:15471013-Alexandrium_andersonii.AAC.1
MRALQRSTDERAGARVTRLRGPVASRSGAAPREGRMSLQTRRPDSLPPSPSSSQRASRPCPGPWFRSGQQGPIAFSASLSEGHAQACCLVAFRLAFAPCPWARRRSTDFAARGPSPEPSLLSAEYVLAVFLGAMTNGIGARSVRPWGPPGFLLAVPPLRAPPGVGYVPSLLVDGPT